MLSSTAKKLAANSVASAGVHNKAWEERRLWAERDTQLSAEQRVPALDSRRFFGRDEEASTSQETRPKKRRKKRDSDTDDVQDLAPKKKKKRKSKKAAKKRKRTRSDSDSDIEIAKRRRQRSASPAPFEWTKALDRLETAMPGRWGHDGYRELHPEQFK